MTDTLQEGTETLPTAGPWAPPVDLPNPELSGWAPPPVHDAPDVAEPEQGSKPWGPIVGGSALGAAIIGLGVFNIFGLAGLAVAGAVAAAGAPVAAIGLSDFRRRLKTGRWRPSGPRSRQGKTVGGSGRLGKMMSAKRGGTGLGRARFGGAAGGARALKGSSAGRKESKAGATGRLRRALSGGVAGGSSGRRAANGRTGQRPAAGLLGRLRQRRAGQRAAAGTARLFGKSLPRSVAARHGIGNHRSRGLGRKRRLLAAMGLGHAPASRKQRRLAKRAMRLNRGLERRRRRYERRDHRRQDRAQRRQQARADRAQRRLARKGYWGRRARAVGRSASRSGRWIGQRAGRPFTAAWRRIMRVQLVRALTRHRLATLTRMFFGAMWRRLKHLLARIPRLLGAPTPEPSSTATAGVNPDAHDDERDSDAPAVARPQRTRRPVPAAVFQAPLAAPAVPTPRFRAKETTMSNGQVLHPAWEAVVEAFRDHIGGYEMPDDGSGIPDTDNFLGSAGEAFRELQAIMLGLGDRFDGDEPVEAEVADHWRDCGGGMGEMAESADDVYQTWRVAQAKDLERHEEPRPNETKTNVPA